MEIDDRFYLMPPDNEAEIYTECSECSNSICIGEDYYDIYRDNFCENCAKFLFQKVAGED